MFAGSAPACAGWVAGLRHEALDNAMKDHTIVKALLGQFLDAGHMVRREIGPKLDHNAAMRCLKN